MCLQWYLIWLAAMRVSGSADDWMIWLAKLMMAVFEMAICPMWALARDGFKIVSLLM